MKGTNGDINSSSLHVSFPSLAWVFSCLTLDKKQKTNLSDNVNVKVLPLLDYITLSQTPLPDGWTRF